LGIHGEGQPGFPVDFRLSCKFSSLFNYFQGHKSEALNFVIALSAHNESFKAMAMTPFMVEFLMRNVEEESVTYLDRWAVGWKSNHLKPHDSKAFTAAASASAKAFPSASSNPLLAPPSSSIPHAHGSVGALAQMGGAAVEEVSDGSWETDDSDADSQHDDDDDDESEQLLPQRVPAPAATAGAKRKALHAQPSPSSASAPQDWEACEHRCFAPRTSGCSL
jgi:hypothetical protein